MKIAITSQGESLDSPVDPRFGRAQKFIVYDLDTDQFHVHENTQNLNASQGAGIQAAETIANLGVEVVLTGNCGPKAFRCLNTANIKIGTNVSGTVSEAIARFKEGEIAYADSANVEGHWV